MNTNDEIFCNSIKNILDEIKNPLSSDIQNLKKSFDFSENLIFEKLTEIFQFITDSFTSNNDVAKKTNLSISNPNKDNRRYNNY